MYKQDPDLCPLGLITALWWGIGEREVDIRQIITALHETMAQVSQKRQKKKMEQRRDGTIKISKMIKT